MTYAVCAACIWRPQAEHRCAWLGVRCCCQQCFLCGRTHCKIAEVVLQCGVWCHLTDLNDSLSVSAGCAGVNVIIIIMLPIKP
jgi:hypothetical protein